MQRRVSTRPTCILPAQGEVKGPLAISTFGLPSVVGLLLLLESGLPVPVPADLLMLLVGERASAGAIAPWLAVLLLELVALVGTSVLFLAVRGPAAAVIPSLGPRVGLTSQRLARASTLLERQGRWALLAGRTTPGLRTLTVVAAAGSNVPARVCVPLLVIGSSVFIQIHFVLGYLFGPLARDWLAKVGLIPLIVVLAVLVLAGILVWWRRRGAATRLMGLAEACCPACWPPAPSRLGCCRREAHHRAAGNAASAEGSRSGSPGSARPPRSRETPPWDLSAQLGRGTDVRVRS